MADAARKASHLLVCSQRHVVAHGADEGYKNARKVCTFVQNNPRMPVLSISSTADPDAATKASFFDELAVLYAEVMESQTSFVSIKFHPISEGDLWLGRADPESDIVLVEADVREGRPVSQRRKFALECMEKFHAEWEIPHSNMKVVFTEHEGVEMMGYERVGDDWG